MAGDEDDPDRVRGNKTGHGERAAKRRDGLISCEGGRWPPEGKNRKLSCEEGRKERGEDTKENGGRRQGVRRNNEAGRGKRKGEGGREGRGMQRLKEGKGKKG